MNLLNNIPLYGDATFRGKCPTEAVEQVTIIRRIREVTPLVFHPRNEGARFKQVAAKHKAEGATAGVPDIVVPGCPAFLCELKRRDIKQSTLSEEQEIYLINAIDAGAFVCVALGADAAWEAFNDWRKIQQETI